MNKSPDEIFSEYAREVWPNRPADPQQDDKQSLLFDHMQDLYTDQVWEPNTGVEYLDDFIIGILAGKDSAEELIEEMMDEYFRSVAQGIVDELRNERAKSQDY